MTRPQESRRILVNGATGSLGLATLAAIRSDLAVGGTRRRGPSAPAAAMHVPDDGRIDPAQLTGIDAIINCAGRIKGTDAELAAINVEHVRHLAMAAEAAGVRRFVQVSSLSVYGRAERIGVDTPICPTSAYGRSKAEAERVLATLGGQLSTISMRLPFLFDRDRAGLLGPLVALFRRAPVFPVARHSTPRSMLTYPDAATLLVKAVGSRHTGAVSAADPQQFDMNLLVRLMREQDLHAPALVRVSDEAIRLVMRVRPSLGLRLFTASELAPDANWVSWTLPIGLEGEIRHLLTAVRRRIR